MNRKLALILAAAVAAAGCHDSGSPSSAAAISAAGGFATLPLGFADVQSTFGGEADSGTTEWAPGDSTGRHHRPGDGQGMMCGGPGRFLGGDFGLGLRHLDVTASPFASCVFDAATGRVACAPELHHGLTVVRSASYADAKGHTQEGYDSLTTDVVNLQDEVSGTHMRRDGDTSVVEHRSDRTVTGLASGHTERTITGTSRGQEVTTGSDSTGQFIAVRTLGDTLQGIVVPVDSAGHPTWPTAGTIIRSMEVSVTYADQSPISASRREVVTFNGSSSATVVISEHGSTRTCSLVPHGALSCS
jgi:hypothetical protein